MNASVACLFVVLALAAQAKALERPHIRYSPSAFTAASRLGGSPSYAARGYPAAPGYAAGDLYGGARSYPSFDYSPPVSYDNLDASYNSYNSLYEPSFAPAGPSYFSPYGFY